MPIDYTKRPATGPAGGPVPPPQPPGHPAAGPTLPPAGPVNLGKVTLTKSAPLVSLTKQGSASGFLRVNLNWNARPAQAPGGFLKRLMAAAQPGIDLDLGCLYELADGTKDVVQALGGTFVSDNRHLANEPIIWLDGDDRSGVNSGGENLHINLNHLRLIRRVLVFAYIYEGVPNWSAANGVVTLYPQSGAPIEVRLDESDPRASMCAIAMLENTGTDLTVRREVRYIHGTQQALDRAYGWGLNWSPARK